MTNKIYYVFDKKAELIINCFVSQNADVATRGLKLQINGLRDKKDNNSLTVLSDCDLYEVLTNNDCASLKKVCEIKDLIHFDLDLSSGVDNGSK